MEKLDQKIDKVFDKTEVGPTNLGEPININIYIKI